MVELDLFRNFRRGVAAPSTDAHRRASARLASALDETIGGEQGTRMRHRGHHRRLAVLAAAVLVVVVVTASAFGTVRDLFGNGKPHVERSNYSIEGKRGNFRLRILFTDQARSWRIVPEPGTEAATGQYAHVTGRGRIVELGGHAQAWHARLEGFVTRPGEAKQRVVITMKGRPQGPFVLAPLHPGLLKRDSGTHTYRYSTG
jgi:hypothetical protein